MTLSAQSESYSRINVHANPAQQMQMGQAGVAIDHPNVQTHHNMVLEVSESELEIIRGLGLQTEVLIEDLRHHYAHQNDQLPVGKSQLTATTPAGFNLGSMGGYLTLQQIGLELDSMAQAYPNLITIKDSIGNTHEGRPIWMVKISDNPGLDEQEPEVMYNALHHAREPMSMMQMMYYMHYLLENYGTDPEVTYLVDNREMYFIPCVNPDGYLYNQTTDPNGGGMWRKNRRDNGGNTYGVDLNRNYGWEWGYDNFGSSPDSSANTFRGPGPFSEPETQAMRNICFDREFKTGLNYHSYGSVLIRPWTYDDTVTLVDEARYHEFGEVMTEHNDYSHGNLMQTLGYKGNGGADDWMYGEDVLKGKIFAFTPEVGEGADGFWPPISRIVPLCELQLEQNLRNAWLAGDYIDPRPRIAAEYDGPQVWLPVDFRNLGLADANAFSATFSSIDPNIASINTGSVNLPAINEGAQATDSFSITLKTQIPNGTVIRGVVHTTVASGIVVEDSISFRYGVPVIVFEDSIDTPLQWNGGWAVTTEKAHSGTQSITDSPLQLYQPNTINIITLTNSIDLSGYFLPRLKFWGTWALEDGWDFVQVLVSNDGNNFQPVGGQYSEIGSGVFQPGGQPLYDGKQVNWVKEDISLYAYQGDTVWLRFMLRSDVWGEYDGFYFDDIEVTGYTQLVGQPEPDPLSALYLYPNPSRDVLRIAGSWDVLNATRLQMYNIVGEQVIDRPVVQGEVISVSHLAKGVYVYRFVGRDGAATMKKLVIE